MICTIIYSQNPRLSHPQHSSYSWEPEARDICTALRVQVEKMLPLVSGWTIQETLSQFSVNRLLPPNHSPSLPHPFSSFLLRTKHPGGRGVSNSPHSSLSILSSSPAGNEHTNYLFPIVFSFSKEMASERLSVLVHPG